MLHGRPHYEIRHYNSGREYKDRLYSIINPSGPYVYVLPEWCLVPSSARYERRWYVRTRRVVNMVAHFLFLLGYTAFFVLFSVGWLSIIVFCPFNFNFIFFLARVFPVV